MNDPSEIDEPTSFSIDISEELEDTIYICAISKYVSNFKAIEVDIYIEWVRIGF